MYLCAHLFSGILIGLGFFYFWQDRRIISVCIAGALLSDLLDKPLVVLAPDIFGSTRTIGHSLLVVLLLLLVAVILWNYQRSILCFAFTAAVFSHQVLDMIWTLPVTWFFPLYGMFQKMPASGGFLQFFWLELTNPSEWVFALVSCIIILGLYERIHNLPLIIFTGPYLRCLLWSMAGLLAVTGFLLIITGTGLSSGGLPGPDKTFVAGFVALCGAVVLILGPGRILPAASSDC